MSTYDDALRDMAPRQRTILDIAADSCTPDVAAVHALLARYKPPHLLTGDELARYEATQRAKVRLDTRRRHLHESGIVRVLPNPGRDVAAIVHEQLRDREALAIVRTWWAEGEPVRPWLFLGGTTGVGKTWAAAWAIADGGGRYLACTHLIRAAAAVREARGPVQIEFATAAWTAIVSAPLLVLDELGREPLATTRDALHDLVDQRGARPTLVLSNVAGKRLREAFVTGDLDARTASRLAPLVLRDSRGRACWDVVGDDMRGTMEAR